MKYRIKEQQWLDKEEADVHVSFFVQEKKKFLFFEWWATLQELCPCGEGCVSSQPKIFKSFSDAKEHIEKLKNSHAREPFIRYSNEI